MAKDNAKNTQAESMTYEVRRVQSPRRQFLDAIEREEETVELATDEVRRVEIATPAPAPAKSAAKKEG